jgi:hypothetical protein
VHPFLSEKLITIDARDSDPNVAPPPGKEREMRHHKKRETWSWPCFLSVKTGAREMRFGHMTLICVKEIV